MGPNLAVRYVVHVTRIVRASQPSEYRLFEHLSEAFVKSVTFDDPIAWFPFVWLKKSAAHPCGHIWASVEANDLYIFMLEGGDVP